MFRARPRSDRRFVWSEMIKYKSLTRTTLDKTENLPLGGIYIIAYMGKVVYIGKATISIPNRIKEHWGSRDVEPFGNWLDKMRLDWCNIRLDVLEAPDDIDINYWMKLVEGLLVRKHSPLFNSYLMSSPTEKVIRE